MPIVDQIKDKDEALQFVEKLGEKIKADPAAFALTKVLQGKLQLDRFVDVEKTKVIITTLLLWKSNGYSLNLWQYFFHCILDFLVN